MEPYRGNVALDSRAILCRNHALLRTKDCAVHQMKWINKMRDGDLITDEEYNEWVRVTLNQMDVLPKCSFDCSRILHARDLMFENYTGLSTDE